MKLSFFLFFFTHQAQTFPNNFLFFHCRSANLTFVKGTADNDVCSMTGCSLALFRSVDWVCVNRPININIIHTHSSRGVFLTCAGPIVIQWWYGQGVKEKSVLLHNQRAKSEEFGQRLQKYSKRLRKYSEILKIHTGFISVLGCYPDDDICSSG